MRIVPAIYRSAFITFLIYFGVMLLTPIGVDVTLFAKLFAVVFVIMLVIDAFTGRLFRKKNVSN